MLKWFEHLILEKKVRIYSVLMGLSLSLAACGGLIPPEDIFESSFAARSEAPLKLKDFRNWAWSCHSSHKTENLLSFDLGVSISDVGQSASGRNILAMRAVDSDCALYTSTYSKVDYIVANVVVISDDYTVKNRSRLVDIAKQFVEEVCDGKLQASRPQELDCGPFNDEEAPRIVLMPIWKLGLRATDDNLNPSYFVFYRGSLINLTKIKV